MFGAILNRATLSRGYQMSLLWLDVIPFDMGVELLNSMIILVLLS